MKGIAIPPRLLHITSTIATLGGIVLGFDAVASAVAAGEPPYWGIFGLSVAAIGGLSILPTLFNFFGDWNKKEERPRRRVGGFSVLVIFYLFAGVVGFFRL